MSIFEHAADALAGRREAFKHVRAARRTTEKRRELLAYEHQSSSTDGRFELQVEPWEARNTHWVLAPQIRDTTNDKILFRPVAHAWSLESAAWQGTQVHIRLCKYPGDQPRKWVDAFVDCERELGQLGGEEALPLAELEAALDRFISQGM